jgi:diguanylate cyclase
MRRYAHTRDESSELLRLAIPLISKQAAGFHPASYALWYEYAAGTNPALRTALDAALASGEPLDDDRVYALHAEHVAGREDSAAQKLRAELERMLVEFARQAASAGEHAQAYGKSLDGFRERLEPATDPHQLGALVGAMIEDTRRMRERSDELQGQLAAGAKEVEALRAELEQARGEALSDPLTGIANRRGFEHAAAQLEAANGGSLAGCSLLMLDIDHFKRCNDTYGHLFGDKVIRSVAQVLAKNVKGRDVPARIGGEEFAVLLPETPLEGARVLAERIRATVGAGRIRRGDSGELVGNITVSLGAAAHAAGETIESLLRRADRALYASKQGGRNRVSLAPAPKKTGTEVPAFLPATCDATSRESSPRAS